MFNLGRLRNIADNIGIPESEILSVLVDLDENPGLFVDELTLHRADASKKPRDVIAVRGRWRKLQERVYQKLLLPRFNPLNCSHGGVRGRSAASNARAHLGNRFALVADVADFYPSISISRVYDLFCTHGCRHEAAQVLTRLCTYDFRLALGLITSPILANEIFKPIDERILHSCQKLGLTYTRFVDDITISGDFDLNDKKSGVEATVRDIINRHGFILAENKTDSGEIHNIPITGVRLKRGHTDASTKFVRETERALDDHISLSKDGPFDGPLLTEGILYGKVHYACSLNSGRRRMLLPRMKMIRWDAVMANAVKRRLLRHRDRLVPRGDPRPDCSEPLALIKGAENYDRFVQSHVIDPMVAPFDT